MLVPSDRARRWLPLLASWILVNVDRARLRLAASARGSLAPLTGAGRLLLSLVRTLWQRTERPRQVLVAAGRLVMARTRRPRRWLAVRGRPVVLRIQRPSRRAAGAVARAVARFDRPLPWLPAISRRGILGLLLVAQLAWPALFHETSAAAQPRRAPVVHAAPKTTPQASDPVPGRGATATGPAPAAPPQPVPTPAQLMPEGMPSFQSTYVPTPEQMDNARAIISTGQQMGLPPRAWVIAVATSLQETNLHNYGNLGGINDHDSLGLFQQRPSSGWGLPDQLTDPHYAATQFYRALLQVPGWQDVPLTVAAQDVQVSAFGDRYAQWEQQATDMVLATYGIGPYAGVGG